MHYQYYKQVSKNANIKKKYFLYDMRHIKTNYYLIWNIQTILIRV